MAELLRGWLEVIDVATGLPVQINTRHILVLAPTKQKGRTLIVINNVVGGGQRIEVDQPYGVVQSALRAAVQRRSEA